MRRLTYQQIEGLYDRLPHPIDGRGLHPKTVYEIHVLTSGTLTDAASDNRRLYWVVTPDGTHLSTPRTLQERSAPSLAEIRPTSCQGTPN